jgi:hypothetical protein
MGSSNGTAQEKVIHLNTQLNLGRCERRQAQLVDRRERTALTESAPAAHGIGHLGSGEEILAQM